MKTQSQHPIPNGTEVICNPITGAPPLRAIVNSSEYSETLRGYWYVCQEETGKLGSWSEKRVALAKGE